MINNLTKMEDDKKKFVNWLKKIIKIDGVITGKQLAKKVGIDPSTISGYLTGRTKGPELSLRLEICKVLGFDYEEIMDIGRRQIAPLPTPLGTEDIKKLIAGEMNKYQTNDIERHLRNKHKAIIHDLQELEKLDPAALKEIHNYIKYQLHEKQQDKAMGEGAAK